jgi:hypothetical protein
VILRDSKGSKCTVFRRQGPERDGSITRFVNEMVKT